MGTSFTASVGNPPDIVTNYDGWLEWYQRLLAFRLAECPLARSTTYYFAQSGNDSTGNGSQALPWKTLAKAQAQITAAASNANLRLRFRRGDVWEETTGLALNKSNITVDAYGTGTKPFFNRFTIKYASSGWTVASGDRYTRAETNDIAWVRDTADRLGIVYKRVATTADVESTPLSFYWVSNVLHINAGSGINPNSKNLEAVISNSSHGIAVTGDGCRIEGIRGDGWGCHRTTTATQAQPMTSLCAGTNACLMIDCDAYYSGSHALAAYTPVTGGINTFIRCRAGYTKFNASNETVFNFYALGGGQEIIEESCITEYGTLPSSDWATSTITRRGIASYAHTNGGTAYVGMLVSRNHLVRDNAWGATSGPNYNNAPPSITTGDVRVWVVDLLQQGGASTGVGTFSTYNGIHCNCRYYLRPYPVGPQALSSVFRGWMVNCLFDLDLTDTTGNRFGAWNWTNNTTADGWMYNCAWIVKTKSGQLFLLDYDGQDNVNVVIKGCVFINAGAGTMGISGHNATGALDYNACYGITTSGNQGYDHGIGNITLDVPILANDLRALDASSPLYQAGDASLGLSNDINGNRRKVSTPSIGPVDAYAGQLVPDVTHVRKGTLYDGSNKTGVLLPMTRRMQGS